MSRAGRVLVTGGAGFVGGHLVRALLGAGQAVRVLDDFSTGARGPLAVAGGPEAELLEGDVRSAAMARQAVEGAEVVFHLAGLPAPPHGPAADALRAEEVNVGGALQILEAAAQQPRRPRVVLASSGAVYGAAEAYVLHEELEPRPTTADGVQQVAVEHHARAHRAAGLDVVVLRLFRCFGPGERWSGAYLPLVPALCRAALLGEVPTLRGYGRPIRDLVYVDNAVRALLAAARPGPALPAAQAGGWIYNVASGEPTSPLSVWTAVAEEAGGAAVAPELEPLPAHEPPHVRVSIARARRDLAYRPEVGLREGLRRTVVACRRALLASGNDWFAPPGGKARPKPPPPPPPSGPARAIAAPPPVPLEEILEPADDLVVSDESDEAAARALPVGAAGLGGAAEP